MKLNCLFAVVAVSFVATLAMSGTAAADGEWQEVQANGDQPWVESDANAPAQPMILPLHRRLPRFYLSSKLFIAPDPVLVDKNADCGCGKKVDDLMGMSVDFDFRFWYLFIGTHLATGGHGDDDDSLSEYAVRAGVIIPFGERVQLVHAVWMGVANWTVPDSEPTIMSSALSSASPDYYDEPIYNLEGLQFGTSLELRVMLSSWFGFTGGLGISTTILEPDIFADDDWRLNRWQADTGILFAW
jgi:hypothetical protein